MIQHCHFIWVGITHFQPGSEKTGCFLFERGIAVPNPGPVTATAWDPNFSLAPRALCFRVNFGIRRSVRRPSVVQAPRSTYRRTCLVGGWAYPSEKYISQLGLLFPKYIYIYIWENNPHVPNHQRVYNWEGFLFEDQTQPTSNGRTHDDIPIPSCIIQHWGPNFYVKHSWQAEQQVCSPLTGYVTGRLDQFAPSNGSSSYQISGRQRH